MAVALVYPQPERGRGKKDPARKDADSSPFSYRRVQQARTVLRFSEELAQRVMKGDLSLDEALQEVQHE